MKKILIVRLPKQTTDEEFIQIVNDYYNALKEDYYCIVLLGENETNKTIFEII